MIPYFYRHMHEKRDKSKFNIFIIEYFIFSPAFYLII